MIDKRTLKEHCLVGVDKIIYFFVDILNMGEYKNICKTKIKQ